MKTNRTNNGGASLVQGCNDDGPIIQSESWLMPHRNLNIHRIVVPVDFSETSRKAFQYAAATALEFGAEIWLLHVVQTYPVVPEMPIAMVDAMTPATNSAVQDLEQWAKTIGPIRTACAVRVGDPAGEIAAFAKRNHADLIVMATSGRTGLAHLVVGSVAEKVVRTAPCPVLIVRDHEQDFLKVDPDDPVLNRAGLVQHSTAA